MIRFRYFLLLLVVSKVNASLAQSMSCASLPQEKSEFGYKNLGNRCEGFYDTKLSGGTLQVVSFLEGSIEFTWNLNTELIIEANKDLKYPLNVRAVALQPETLYRMDAVLDTDKTFMWPIGPYIYIRNIRPAQLGVYGWSGNEDDKTFSPINITEKGKAKIGNKVIVLKIRTLLDLVNFRWSFAPTNSYCGLGLGGTPSPPYKGDMSAGSIIEIQIPQSSEHKKLYCLEIRYQIENQPFQSQLIRIRL
jgi:hypothetical protein